MGYGHEQKAPPIPAVMLPSSTAAAIRDGMATGVYVSLRILKVKGILEDAAGGGGGMTRG